VGAAGLGAGILLDELDDRSQRGSHDAVQSLDLTSGEHHELGRIRQSVLLLAELAPEAARRGSLGSGVTGQLGAERRLFRNRLRELLVGRPATSAAATCVCWGLRRLPSAAHDERERRRKHELLDHVVLLTMDWMDRPSPPN
jgi:hypothetical protein